MSGAWYPRYSEDGQHLAYGDTEIVVDGVSLGSGIAPVWQDARTVVWRDREAGIWRYVLGGTPEKISEQAFNVLTAGGWFWAGWNPADGLVVQWVPAWTHPLAGEPFICPDGALLFVDPFHSEIRSLLFGGTVVKTGPITNPRGSRLCITWLEKEREVWGFRRNGSGHVDRLWTVEQGEGRQTQPVDVHGESWVLVDTHGGFFLAPYGASEGYVFDNGGQTHFPTVAYDSVTRTIKVAFTDAHGVLGTVDFPEGSPKNSVPPLTTPSLTVPPLGKRLFCYFWDDLTVDLPRNATTVNLADGIGRIDGGVAPIAWFVGGGDYEQLSARAEAVLKSPFSGRRPIIGIADGFWPHAMTVAGWPLGIDILGLALYPQRDTQEMAAQIGARVRESLQSFSGSRRFLLIVKQYRNPGESYPRTELPRILQEAVDIAAGDPRVLGFGIFSGPARQGGVGDHPELVPLHRQVFAQIEGRPLLAAPPQITITGYHPKEGIAPVSVAVNVWVSAESGPITSLVPRWRRLGTAAWHEEDSVAVSDPDAGRGRAVMVGYQHAFREPGQFEIGVRATGPGGTDQTAQRRLVNVRQKEPSMSHPLTVVSAHGRKYVVEGVDDRAWALKTVDGFYVTEEPDGRLVLDRTVRGPWEVFTQAIDPPPPVTLPRLVARGGFFALETGEPWTAIECTDFQLLHHVLHGVDIRPVLDQRAEVGFNLLRILVMADVMFHLHPQDHPDFDEAISRLFERLLEYRLRGEFVVFADTQRVMPNLDEQIAYWERIGRLVRPVPNVLVEAVNENNQHENRVDALDRFWTLDGVLCSRGSNGADQVPPRPWMSYEVAHWNDVFEWWRKAGHNTRELTVGDPAGAYAGSGVPALANETTRFPDRDSSIQHAYDAAAGAALLCAGSCFHSVRGKSSEVWDGHELACAQAWVRGAQSVPLEFQAGEYRRMDPGTDLRVYRRVLADGRFHEVRIRH